ncbi:MAG: hypothetical protein QOD11_1673 [Bradyrhizobium sp.]|nr:hypothetical protein [Bradyrhizobium sp.]
MKDKRGSLPPNVVELHASRPRLRNTAVMLGGLKLMKVFLRIQTGQDRKRVFDLAKQLALNNANTRT